MTSSTLHWTVTTSTKVSVTFSCWGVIQSGHLTNYPSHFVMLHCVTRRRVTVSMNTKWRYTVLYNGSAVLRLWWCVKINRNSSLRPGRRPRSFAHNYAYKLGKIGESGDFATLQRVCCNDCPNCKDSLWCLHPAKTCVDSSNKNPQNSSSLSCDETTAQVWTCWCRPSPAPRWTSPPSWGR